MEDSTLILEQESYFQAPICLQEQVNPNFAFSLQLKTCIINGEINAFGVIITNT